MSPYRLKNLEAEFRVYYKFYNEGVFKLTKSFGEFNFNTYIINIKRQIQIVETILLYM